MVWIGFCFANMLYFCITFIATHVILGTILLIFPQAQFTGALLQCVYSLYIDCNFPKWMHYVLLGYATSFVILFTNFYIIAYSKRDSTSAKKSSDESAKILNGSVPGHENTNLLAKKDD